ncbi:MAG: sugar transferase [Syntrophobacteraceae bacterium]
MEPQKSELKKRTSQIRVKYLCDRIFACLLLAFLWPAFLLMALAVKLDDGGPVFFRQRRPGLHGRPFVIWKFRTMITDADALLDAEGRVKGSVSRVTRVGKFLRQCSLDELPQLINILCGEMSFIGPRPALEEHFCRYTDRQKQRVNMKPGVTGLAQVDGRNTLKWSERIERDLKYIEEYSLLLDLEILARTVKVVLFRRGIVLDRNPEQVDDLPAACTPHAHDAKQN